MPHVFARIMQSRVTYVVSNALRGGGGKLKWDTTATEHLVLLRYRDKKAHLDMQCPDASQTCVTVCNSALALSLRFTAYGYSAWDLPFLHQVFHKMS
eukprot:187630-Amphidinium_carterae.1